MEFTHTFESSGVELGGVEKRRQIPPLDWSRHTGPTQAGAVGLLHSWWNEEKAFEREGGRLFVPHTCVVELTDAQSGALGLPLLSPFLLTLEHEHTLADDAFRIRYSFLHPDGRPVLAPMLAGAFLHLGKQVFRLSKSHYQITQGVEAINSELGGNLEERLRVFSRFAAFLPQQNQEAITASGYLQSTTVVSAAAFTLQLQIRDGRFGFRPTLVAKAGDVPEEGEHAQSSNVLPTARHDAFLQQLSPGKERYTLGSGYYVVLEPPLARALDLVQQAQRRAELQQVEFFKNPRSFLRAALGDELSDDELDSIFVETPQYLADRVTGIGRWSPPVLPWVRIAKEPWLPPLEAGIEIQRVDAQGEIKPVRVPVAPDEMDALLSAVRKAQEAGEPSVVWNGESIPASQETVNAIEAARDGSKGTSGEITERQSRSRDTVVLLIEQGLETLPLLASGTRERQPNCSLEYPLGITSTLKEHQITGLKFLQENWKSGSPGILLADDMGLGKTLQCLAFLRWLRDVTPERKEGEGGVLIVAPTGLLMTWEQEEKKHLERPGLGRVERVYGKHLSKLKQGEGNDLSGEAKLDINALERADWVLTTYETLRDYQHSFGGVPFRCMILDEVQKIKTPGTLVTTAVKAMNADFVVAMTGTPIETRMADLWCIMDRLNHGLLGTLREFSKKYEDSPTDEDLLGLRQILIQPDEARPARMLRRLKEDQLKGLPTKTAIVQAAEMSPEQAGLYRLAVESAQGIEEKAQILQALHQFRRISLHPWLTIEEERPLEPSAFVAASARVRLAFRYLEDTAQRKEKALVFLDSKRMTRWMHTLLESRFGITVPIINGEVPGARRQQLVDEFQNPAHNGKFGVMLLSPRAAGVGLTITAANHVIHLERWWNPAVEDQCTDRVYRIGQEKPVSVFIPQAVHPDSDLSEFSFDLRLHNLMETRRQRSRSVLCPPVQEGDAEHLFGETVRH